MYNYWYGCAVNPEKEYLASNQVVGGSNLSERAKYIKHLTHFRKFHLPIETQTSHSNLIFNVAVVGVL